MAEQNVSGVAAEVGAPQESGAESAAVPSSAAATAVAEIAPPPLRTTSGSSSTPIRGSRTR